MIWSLDVPPRIKLFGWKVGVGGLATKANIARRIMSFSGNCDICGYLEDSDLHALFTCPIAQEIWAASELTNRCGMDALFQPETGCSRWLRWWRYHACTTRKVEMGEGNFRRPK